MPQLVLLLFKELEGTACYVGLLPAPAEGFGQYDVRRVPDAVSKFKMVQEGVRKVSYGVRKVSYVVRKV